MKKYQQLVRLVGELQNIEAQIKEQLYWLHEGHCFCEQCLSVDAEVWRLCAQERLVRDEIARLSSDLIERGA